MTPESQDSFEIIKVLFERSPEPTHAQALEIYDALHDVYWRLMRVRQFAPTTDYSAKVWRLLGMVGMPNRSLDMVDGKPKGNS